MTLRIGFGVLLIVDGVSRLLGTPIIVICGSPSWNYFILYII